MEQYWKARCTEDLMCFAATPAGAPAAHLRPELWLQLVACQLDDVPELLLPCLRMRELGVQPQRRMVRPSCHVQLDNPSVKSQPQASLVLACEQAQAMQGRLQQAKLALKSLPE